MRYSVGIDIKRDSINCGLFDENKCLVSRRSAVSDSSLSPPEFFDVVIRCVRSFMEEKVITNDNIIGVGVALPALVKRKEGKVLKGFGFPKLSDFNARDYLNNSLGDVKVVVDAAVNAEALAEHRLGAGRDRPNMIYCSLDMDIAATAIINSELFNGAGDVSGLYSHCVVSLDEGMECECGNTGCVSSWSSGEMIVRHVRQWIEEGRPTIIDEIAGRVEHITQEHISIAYERGDAMAEIAIRQMGRSIGMWLHCMRVMLDIDYIVLNGSLLKMGKKLVGPIRRTFDTFNNWRLRTDFANAQIKRDIGIIGSIELLNQFDNQ